MRLLITMAALFSIISRLFGGDDKPAYDLADIYVEMREQVLTLTPEKIGELKEKKVWAVLMETGYPEAAATLVVWTVGSGGCALMYSGAHLVEWVCCGGWVY